MIITQALSGFVFDKIKITKAIKYDMPSGDISKLMQALG